jgi:hypothetical protein
MATAVEYPARGKVVEASGNTVVFHPAATNYQMHLGADGTAPTASGEALVDGVVRVRARKVMTVPTGGNFVAPIFGTPKTIQGRVRWLDERHLVVQAGCPVLVELPAESSAIDLNNGPIAVGVMVNVSAYPGATFSVVAPAVK